MSTHNVAGVIVVTLCFETPSLFGAMPVFKILRVRSLASEVLVLVSRRVNDIREQICQVASRSRAKISQLERRLSHPDFLPKTLKTENF